MFWLKSGSLCLWVVLQLIHIYIVSMVVVSAESPIPLPPQPLQCKPDQKYVQETTGCENNCKYLGVKNCPIVFKRAQEGCLCNNNNFVKNENGDCVPPSFCKRPGIDC